MFFTPSPWGFLLTKPFIHTEIYETSKPLYILTSGFFEARFYIRWLSSDKPNIWYSLPHGIPHLDISNPCFISFLPDKDKLADFILKTGNPLLILNDFYIKPFTNNDTFISYFGHIKATPINDFSYDFLLPFQTIDRENNLQILKYNFDNEIRRIFFMDLDTTDFSHFLHWIKDKIFLDIHGKFSKFSSSFFKYFDLSKEYSDINLHQLRFLIHWIINLFPKSSIWINWSHSHEFDDILTNHTPIFFPFH